MEGLFSYTKIHVFCKSIYSYSKMYKKLDFIQNIIFNKVELILKVIYDIICVTVCLMFIYIYW